PSGGAGSAGITDDPLEKLTGSSVRNWTTRLQELRAGRGGPMSTMTYFFSRFMQNSRQQQIERLLHEANFNPELRDALMMDLGPNNTPAPKAQRTINWYMLNAGMGFWNMGPEQAVITQEPSTAAPAPRSQQPAPAPAPQPAPAPAAPPAAPA